MPVVAFLVLSMFLVAPAFAYTGSADFPELFKYSAQKNANLETALLSISSSFKDSSIPITQELLSAIMATLDKEVGSDYLPIEENGDYGMGTGCTYKINGSSRSTSYDGGVDYKGRGYIQITGKSNYQTYCGSDCVGTSTPELDICGCKNQWNCTVTDASICPQVKALQPDHAAKIFASYFTTNKLVSLSNSKNYWDVGKIINGGNAYASDFSIKANEYLTMFSNNPDKTQKLLTWLDSGTPAAVAVQQQESSQEKSSTVSAQSTNQPRISWIKKGFGGHSETSSIQQTSDGGYIIASSADWDNVRLIKTDSKGNATWDKVFEGPEEAEMQGTKENAFSVQQMSDGGYNILASTGNLNGIFGWLIKTDSQGNIIWDKMVEEQARIISGRQTSDGGYIIATISPENVGLSKIDSEGNKLWDKTFEETTFDKIDISLPVQLPVQQTKDGGYVITCNKGNNGTLLIKTDSQGNELWNKLFSPRPSLEFAYSVQQTSDGGYIIAGEEERLDRISSNYEHWNTYGALIKTDSSGNEVWNKTFDIYEDSKKEKWTKEKWTWMESVLQTNDGGYVLAGTARVKQNGYDECIWVIKTDSSGNKEWDKKFTLFSGTSYRISSIQQTSDGGYILGGDSDFYGPWLVKIGGNEDVTDTENNPVPKTDTQKQEVNAENEPGKNQSGTQEKAVASKVPGFNGILAIAALLCIFIMWRKD